jgi:hypothetical protein
VKFLLEFVQKEISRKFLSLVLAFILVLSFLLSLIVFFNLVGIAHAQVIFADDFESGSLTNFEIVEFPGASSTVQSSIKYAGNYAAKQTVPAGSGFQSTELRKMLTNEYTTLYARVWMYFPQLPVGGDELQYLMDFNMPDAVPTTLGDLLVVHIDSSGRWKIVYFANSAKNYYIVDSPTPSANTWYCVTIGITLSSTNGFAGVWINDNPIMQLSNLDNLDGLPYTTIPHVFCSLVSTDPTQGYTVYKDNFAIAEEYIGTGGEPPSLKYDLNGDGAVNMLDISIVAKAFGSRVGDSRWNSIADVDKNQIVNILDISMVAKDYGKSI